jgi:DNA polymerase delta subunit 1
LNPKTDSIGTLCLDSWSTAADAAQAFQQIEIEEAYEPKHGPSLRLFGVNQNGNSVLAHVHGFKPYFYIAAPSGFLNKDLEPLKDTINVS